MTGPAHITQPFGASRLQDRLDAITTRTRELVQPERLARSEHFIADLFATGVESGVLTTGTSMPTFALEDAVSGKLVRSADLLALGPLVITFFRGRWCPYCTTELTTWRDLVPELRRHRALLVALSPQTARQNAFFAEQLFRDVPQTDRFPILSDPGALVAASFGLAYSVREEDRTYFQSILVNIPHANSGLNYRTAPETAWRLPLPGTFVVSRDGPIAFAEAHADFRVRPEPSDVLQCLAQLSR